MKKLRFIKPGTKAIYYIPGYVRTMLEPKVDVSPPPGGWYNGYLRRVKGKTCFCYCNIRYDWLLRTLVRLGVNVREFAPGSDRVSRHTCQEIARALRRLREDKTQLYLRDEAGELLVDPNYVRDEILWFSRCGGIILHGWISVREMHDILEKDEE